MIEDYNLDIGLFHSSLLLINIKSIRFIQNCYKNHHDCETLFELLISWNHFRMTNCVGFLVHLIEIVHTSLVTLIILSNFLIHKMLFVFIQHSIKLQLSIF